MQKIGRREQKMLKRRVREWLEDTANITQHDSGFSRDLAYEIAVAGVGHLVGLTADKGLTAKRPVIGCQNDMLGAKMPRSYNPLRQIGHESCLGPARQPLVSLPAIAIIQAKLQRNNV